MVYVIGHKNPDTDSVNSAIGLSILKNRLGYNTRACILGSLNKETEYILDFFKVKSPEIINDVRTQIKDLNFDKVKSLGPNHTILKAYKLMEENKIRTLGIVDDNNKLLGIVTMKDIAMWSIGGDFYHLKTRLKNIANDLEGDILVGEDKEINGKISVVAFYYDTIKYNDILNEESIVIVGDRYDIVDHAIDCNVKLIIITGGSKLPDKYIAKAKEERVSIISVKGDTYKISKLINQCNYVSSIMVGKDIIRFDENEYLEDIREELSINRHSNYPVVNGENKYLGFISRRHILNPNKKKVILVDHNEYSQSVKGLNEAKILEIIDHHKLGDISTNTPINFRNMPVGSTCTIVFKMFKEANIDIDYSTAGILLTGIISDTLYLKSPTTTDIDRSAVQELNNILDLDLDRLAMDMFRAGTSLEGQSIEEIFYKDFKEFNVEGKKIGIGQVFTLDFEEVFNREDQFMDFINKIHSNRRYYLTLLLVTDIMKEGSYLLYKSELKGLVSNAFNKENKQGIFVENIVSRKKQVIPRILDAINVLG